jgi:hypothetical protein
MCPQRFAPKSYDAAKLALLQEVFDKSWHVLALRFPNRTKLEEDHIKTVLAKAIVELSVEGAVDGPELFKRSLKSVLETVGREPLKKRKARARLIVS